MVTVSDNVLLYSLRRIKVHSSRIEECAVMDPSLFISSRILDKFYDDGLQYKAEL